MKLLTIGNSFTDSLAHDLPALAYYEHADLILDRANFGGCELRRHWSYVEAEEADVDCRIYCGGVKLRDILANNYDVVTIQQASHESWRSETFEPYAGRLIDYIRRHAPRSEVIVQQTWAYRADAPRLGEWGISQQEMHERLTENYRALAAAYGLRLIPTGNAVALSRRYEKHPFKPYPESLIGQLVWPDLPPQASDVVGQCMWRKNSEGKLVLNRDSIHLNRRGDYMQACLWYGFLLERDPRTIAFEPDDLDREDAVFLRDMAARALGV